MAEAIKIYVSGEGDVKVREGNAVIVKGSPPTDSAPFNGLTVGGKPIEVPKP